MLSIRTLGFRGSANRLPASGNMASAGTPTTSRAMKKVPREGIMTIILIRRERRDQTDGDP
jgi:hypothetical protein